MAVRVSGPGSPLERYQGRQISAESQPATSAQIPTNHSNHLQKKLVDAGSLVSISQTYYAAEAAVVRLGRSLGGATTERVGMREAVGRSPGGGRSLSVEEVSRLLAALGESDEVREENGDGQAAHKGAAMSSNRGAGVEGDGFDEASLVAKNVSESIRGSRLQALWSHAGE